MNMNEIRISVSESWYGFFHWIVFEEEILMDDNGNPGWCNMKTLSSGFAFTKEEAESDASAEKEKLLSELTT